MAASEGLLLRLPTEAIGPLVVLIARATVTVLVGEIIVGEKGPKGVLGWPIDPMPPFGCKTKVTPTVSVVALSVALVSSRRAAKSKKFVEFADTLSVPLTRTKGKAFSKMVGTEVGFDGCC